MQKVHLYLKDIAKINEIIRKFPEIDSIRIEQDNSSGIGTFSQIKFTYNFEEILCEISVTIHSSEDW